MDTRYVIPHENRTEFHNIQKKSGEDSIVTVNNIICYDDDYGDGGSEVIGTEVLCVYYAVKMSVSSFSILILCHCSTPFIFKLLNRNTDTNM